MDKSPVYFCSVQQTFTCIARVSDRGEADDLLKTRRAGALVQSGLIRSQRDGRRQLVKGLAALKTFRISQEYLE